MVTKQAVGISGENLAVKILSSRGYKIITKNFRSRYGEIDIIAMDRDELVFVEVKTRLSNKYGKPEEAVNPLKLARIKKTIDYFLLMTKNKIKQMRIEVIALEYNGNELVSSKIIKVVQ